MNCTFDIVAKKSLFNPGHRDCLHTKWCDEMGKQNSFTLLLVEMTIATTSLENIWEVFKMFFE